jgi:hypothetical protein
MTVLHETFCACRGVYTLSRRDGNAMARSLAILVGCALAAWVASAALAGDGTLTGIAPPTRIPTIPLAVPTPRGTPVTTSAIPRAVRRAVVTDAALRFNVATNEVVLTRAEQVTWPDASLGCPEPGRSYAQMQVAGFRVVAMATAGDFLYHTDALGSIVLCAPPAAHP